MKPTPHHRDQYFDYARAIMSFQDMDIYGHLNNSLHNQYFDNAINRYLSLEGGLCMRSSAVIGLIVNSGCDYFKEVSWPENEYLDVGVRVNKLGRSSVQYAGALFIPGEDLALAQGSMTHVWVDRVSRDAVAIPDEIREAMVDIFYSEQ
jgi:acyl-CoA thioester hydrolase